MLVYKQWDVFCRRLKEKGLISVSASTALSSEPGKQFIILKHDVETNPLKALRLAQIENKHSMRGSYYVQGYLLNNSKNIEILKLIQELGHEISYHHDVMDSNKGNIYKAAEEFQRNIEIFDNNGFPVKTVCQHGNPLIERIGYSSNRDFFRNKFIAQQYKHITEIMLNFKSRIGEQYLYISDAGYGWKIIFDPENNDVVKCNVKDVTFKTLDKVVEVVENGTSVIVSTHPHRWHGNVLAAKVKNATFKSVMTVIKSISKIPFMKNFISKFYYLAKKI